MDFEGHQLHKIDKYWVFDLTTFIGYSVEMYEDKIKSYTKAFIVNRDNDTGSYTFEKVIEVPVKIMRKAVAIVQDYRKEALLKDEC